MTSMVEPKFSNSVSATVGKLNSRAPAATALVVPVVISIGDWTLPAEQALFAGARVCQRAL